MQSLESGERASKIAGQKQLTRTSWGCDLRGEGACDRAGKEASECPVRSARQHLGSCVISIGFGRDQMQLNEDKADARLGTPGNTLREDSTQPQPTFISGILRDMPGQLCKYTGTDCIGLWQCNAYNPHTILRGAESWC